MKVLIVEDDPISRKLLTAQIKNYDPNIRICAELNSVQDTVNFFRNGETVDLAFFDIQLSDGNSFEVFKRISISTPIIFTTAYENYTLRAFKVNSIDYLLKPINYQELSAALNQYRQYHQHNNTDLVHELHSHNVNGGLKKRFLVKIGDNFISIAVEDIALIYADGKTTYLKRIGSSRRYVIDYTLEMLERNLLDPNQFFRINRKFIVNVEALSEVKSYVNGRLKVLTHQPGPADMIVSRERVSDFKSWLNQ